MCSISILSQTLACQNTGILTTRIKPTPFATKLKFRGMKFIIFREVIGYDQHDQDNRKLCHFKSW